MKVPELYKKHHVDREHTSLGLFRALNKRFKISKVFYPGSHVHITPSLIFSDVTYADSFRNTYQFFDNTEVIDFIKQQKEYSEESIIRFYQQDYNKPFENLGSEFDLVISQYAGFVGQAAKAYLRKGGLLVCNNSHGDASMTSLDTDFSLVAVYKRQTDEKFNISDDKLETYLQPKNGIEPSKEQLIKSMKGVGYTKSASGYVFKKVNG